jgi:S1-C subfamily serine protease
MPRKSKKPLQTQLKPQLSKLKALKTRLASWYAQARPAILRAALITFVMLSGAAVMTAAPGVHEMYLRSDVGAKVYVVRGAYNARGGGTGFAIKAPSGQSYVMTNDHVCAGSQDGINMFVHDDTGVGIPRRILEKSVYTDLCILEGMPGVEGLELTSEPDLGQQLYVVGHPKLMPLTVSKGSLIGEEDVIVPLGLVKDKSECSQPKHVMIPLISLIFGIDPGPDYTGPSLCAEKIKGAYLTNVIIQPGNSGSPVVDAFGNVVAVAFAGDGLGWGIMVSNKDLKDFLKLY